MKYSSNKQIQSNKMKLHSPLVLSLIFLKFFLFESAIYSQRTGTIRQSNEWSKEGSLFGAKSFIFKEILGSTEIPRKFALIPLYAASSEELTTVFYKSEELDKTGIVLCFYGSFWNEKGVLFTGYNYKNIPRKDALEFLEKIETVIEENEKFLKDEKNINNIFFDFDDMSILVYHDGGIKMRVFWDTFDSTWEERAFYWTKERFEREL